MKKRSLWYCAYVAFLLFSLFPAAAAGDGRILIYETGEELPPYRIMTAAGPVGFEIDIVNAIFKDSPYRIEYRTARLDADKPDKAPASPQAAFFGLREADDASKKYLTFSEPITLFRWGFFSKNLGIPRLNYRVMKGYRIGVTGKQFPYMNLTNNGFRNVQVFDTRDNAVRALYTGEIDLLFDEALSVRHILIRQKMDGVIQYHPEFEISTPVAVAARKEDAALLSFVNERLRGLKKDGAYESIYQKHFLSHSHLFENQRRERAYTTAAGLVALFSVIGILAAFFYYRQRLRAAHEKAFADTLIENATSFIIIWDENLNIVRTNRRIEKFLGYSKEELTGMNASEIIAMPNSIANYSLPMKMKSRRGNTIDVLWDISPFSRDSEAGRCVMATGSDITEINRLRRSLEASFEQLQESERRFELATSGGNVGIFSCDMAKNEVYISAVGYELLGCDKHPSNLTHGEWLSWIHPSDINIFQLNVLSVESRASTNPSSEIRVRKGNGEYGWFLFSFKAQLDENENMAVLYGAFLDIDERKKMELLTRRLAFEDSVSGTQNRHYLMKEGEKILLSAQKNNLGVGLVIFDIDGFKLLNMQKGTAAGDQLLREVGTRVKSFLSSVGLLARLSGDEFACLLPFDMSDGITDKLGAAMEALKDVILGIDATRYGMKRITVCAGSSVFPIDSIELTGLIENASASLVEAKAQGAGSLKIYDSNVKSRMTRDDILRRDIQNLIRKNQLKAYYQPKIDLTTGFISGAEALARWDHPDFGIIPPNYFIKMSEDIGVITAVDNFMLRETCIQNAKWQSLGLPPIRIAVNMSAEGFFSDRTIEYIYGLLLETKLDPKWLEIELTESKAMQDIQKAIDSMQKLKMLGVTLSLDDFGTGYSSLNHMKKLPIRVIKLDRSFIVDLETNTASQTIVNTVVQLSKKLNLTVTVEGVENSIQELQLRNIGCEHAQGYLYSKPIPAEEFEALLRSGKPLSNFKSYDQRNIA